MLLWGRAPEYTPEHPCPLLNKPDFAHVLGHRGNVSVAQENSKDAVDGVSKGAIPAAVDVGPEFDVFEIKSGELVAFHDEDMARSTGTNRDITDVTAQEVQAINYLANIDGYDYGVRRPIVMLHDLLPHLFNTSRPLAERPTLIYLDLKPTSFTSPSNVGKKTAEALNPYKNIIVASNTPIPSAATSYKVVVGTYLAQASRQFFDNLDPALRPFVAISIYYVPDTIPLGEHWLMRSRLPEVWGKSNMVEVPSSFLESELDALQVSMRHKSCIAVYGVFGRDISTAATGSVLPVGTELAAAASKTHVKLLNVDFNPPGHPDYLQSAKYSSYKSNKAGWAIMIFLTALWIALMLLCLALGIWQCRVYKTDSAVGAGASAPDREEKEVTHVALTSSV